MRNIDLQKDFWIFIIRSSYLLIKMSSNYVHSFVERSQKKMNKYEKPYKYPFAITKLWTNMELSPYANAPYKSA